MISLVLRGKLPVSEDALTAAFFDAFRYTREENLLGRILLRAKQFKGGHALPAFDDFEVGLWPDLGGKEPDAWLYLRRGGVTVCRLLVEVKLGAEKSSFGPVDRDARSGDQLAYYLLEAINAAVEPPCALLYLTHHGAMPRDALQETSEELERHEREEYAGRLFWLSWRDVHEELVTQPSLPPPLEDIRHLLEHVQMFRFRGIRVEDELGPLGSPSFYTGPSPSPSPSGGFHL